MSHTKLKVTFINFRKTWVRAVLRVVPRYAANRKAMLKKKKRENKNVFTIDFRIEVLILRCLRALFHRRVCQIKYIKKIIEKLSIYTQIKNLRCNFRK